MASKPVHMPQSVPVEAELERLRDRVAALEAEVAAGQRRERALEAQAERWEAFSRLNPVWFWETDEDLRYTYFSEDVLELAGVPAEWHYGKTREGIGAPKSMSTDVWHGHLEAL